MDFRRKQLTERKATVLGLSASLRNARFGAGSDMLIADLKQIKTRSELDEYLRSQARIRLEDFVAAGRSAHLTFDRIYHNLLAKRSGQGLSNSEVVLAAGLWGAYQLGCEIEHLGLSRHFPANLSEGVDLDELKERLIASDAILLSTPIYFGYRSSVAHDLIEMIRTPSVRMTRAPPIYVPAAMTVAEVTMTQNGTSKLSIRPFTRSASVITPMVFWASLEP